MSLDAQRGVAFFQSLAERGHADDAARLDRRAGDDECRVGKEVGKAVHHARGYGLVLLLAERRQFARVPARMAAYAPDALHDIAPERGQVSGTLLNGENGVGDVILFLVDGPSGSVPPVMGDVERFEPVGSIGEGVGSKRIGEIYAPGFLGGFGNLLSHLVACDGCRRQGYER